MPVRHERSVVPTYMNEYATHCAGWLRNLYPVADVDDRSICEVGISDVLPYDRVHLFAGIGGWEYALHLADWPGAQPVWTGSCPCQPFSQSGKRKGTDDERHLWPEMLRLIAGNRPPIVFGEQVASKLGLGWFDGVRTDLAGIGYSCGMAVLPAASVGSPQKRERLFWVAHTHCHVQHGPRQGQTREAGSGGDDPQRRERWSATQPPRAGTHLPWSRHIGVECADGKRRRLPHPECGVLPLAARLPGGVECIRAYGNSVVPQVAAAFVRAYIDATGV